MAVSAADEDTFILSDEIIDRIHSFFPPPNDHCEKIQQACAAVQALIKVIGMVLCEMDFFGCWEITKKAIESSFDRMMKDVPAIRAEVEGEQGAQSIH